MYHIDLYLLLIRPGASEPDEALKLPMDADAIHELLVRSMSTGESLVQGAIVPVVYRGEPEPGLVAAIYWATGMGRFAPLEYFEIRDAIDIDTAVQAIVGIQAENDLEEPVPIYIHPGATLR